MRRLELCLVVTVGLVLTLFVAWTAHKREVHDRREAFLQLAENQTATIARTIQNIRDVQLESLAQLCSAQKTDYI